MYIHKRNLIEIDTYMYALINVSVYTSMYISKCRCAFRAFVCMYICALYQTKIFTRLYTHTSAYLLVFRNVNVCRLSHFASAIEAAFG